MNLRRIACSALLVFGLASASWARDICLEHTAGQFFVFRKVKALHPGGAVPLTGFYYGPGYATSPFDGTAMMKADGTVVVGLFAHGIGEGGNNFTAEWTTDMTFAGTMQYDSNGDFVSDGAILYHTIDCRTLTLP